MRRRRRLRGGSRSTITAVAHRSGSKTACTLAHVFPRAWAAGFPDLADVPELAMVSAWRRALVSIDRRTARLTPTSRGLLWASGAGLSFCVLNALARTLAARTDPFQAQFLRYFFGLVVLLPLVWRQGVATFMPQRVGPQFTRGAVHTVGLLLWFSALPRIPLADMTAIGFTTPLFIMVGAWIFFREPMRWERWLATAIGFLGVMVVVGPKVSGNGGWFHLVMLASAPVFAASFLLTKALTRHETAGVILVWQAISISIFSLPLAWTVWQPVAAWDWAGFMLCGALGSLGHYCLTRSFKAADISATQSVKFLDLVWSSLLGWAVFADVPTSSTMIGGGLICVATLWVAHRESARG